MEIVFISHDLFELEGCVESGIFELCTRDRKITIFTYDLRWNILQRKAHQREMLILVKRPSF